MSFEAWRKRKDFVTELYDLFYLGIISEDEMRKRIEEYDLKHKDLGCSHIEGKTPLGGWIICKLCGDNLKKV